MKKVLRAIGGFFAKIGRWIANTAWIQPLLIVGGIFAIIFSIPYIKTAIEKSIESKKEDERLAYIQNRAIDLTGAEVGEGESKLDMLLNALDNGDTEYVKTNFGEKFFLSFAEKTCENCKECAKGYSKFESIFASEYRLNKDPNTQETLAPFKYISVMADTLITDSTSEYDGEYAAKLVLNRHQSFLEEIVGEFSEQEDKTSGYSYHLLNNLNSGVDSMKTSIGKLSNINSDGIDVPTTLLIDLTGKAPEGANVKGVTAVIFNYTSIMTEDVNVVNEAKFLRDCWTYSNAFSSSGEDINYYYEA